MADKMWNWSLPAGEVGSMLSRRLLKPIDSYFAETRTMHSFLTGALEIAN